MIRFRRLFLFFTGIFLFQLQTSFAQDRYELSLGVDLPLALSGTSLTGLGIHFDKKLKPFTKEELARLNAENIPAFDRWVTKQWSRSAGRASDHILRASVLAPIVFTLSSGRMRSEWGTVGVAFVETALLSVGLTELAKTTVKRPRPALYNPDVPLSYKLDNTDVRKSFFSGHVSTTAMSSFFAAKVYADFHPNSDAKTLVYAGAFAATGSVAVLRMLAGKHFLSDVLVGALVGGAVGYFVPKLHQKDRFIDDSDNSFKLTFFLPL